MDFKISNSKYQKRILHGALKNKLEFLFRQCAETNDWKIEELHIQIDYVYLLF
ncbi:transposase [Candidatus Dependentiae bacterium]|nr:transposase [Candidatus Dependentiae bacterium]